MKKCEQLYEGKAKKVFATEDPEYVIVSYKDDATAFDGLKKGTIAGKGVVNNKMSNYLMQLLEKQGVPTHYVEEISDRETIVRKVSFLSRLLSETFPPVRLQSVTALKKALFLPSRQSNFHTRMMIFTIPFSIHIMLSLSDLQPRRRLRISNQWHSRSILFSRSISRVLT